jgi:hypothetical protein
VVLQLSASIGSHAVQAEPPPPHWVSDGEMQTAPRQQPLGQLVPLQAPPVQIPLLQICPGPQAGPAPHRHRPPALQVLELSASQATHVSPPMPQVMRLRVLQVEPTQQPAAHEVASQTHWPPTHR